MEENLKKRPGCVTAWLIVAIVVNAITAISYVSMFDVLGGGIATALIVGACVNIGACIMLMNWKKTGFYILLVVTVVSFFINMIIGDVGLVSFAGLLAPLIWYLILQVKNSEGQKCWDMLK